MEGYLRVKNIGLGLFFVIVAGIAYAATTSFPEVNVSYKDPAVYPRVIIGLICLLSIILIVQGALERRRAVSGKAVGADALSTPLTVFGVTIVYFFLLQIIGFILASFAFLFVTFMVFGGNPKQGLIFALCMTIGEYLLFGFFLRVRLPEPILTHLLHIL